MNLTKKMESLQSGQVEAVTLVLGEEKYLLEQVEAAILKGAFSNEPNEFNFARFDMESMPVDAALEEATSLPFFDDERVVFIENPYFLTGEKKSYSVEHDVDWFTEYLSSPSDFTKLVILAPYEKLDKRKKVTKALYKQADIIEVKTPKPQNINNYLQESLQSNGYRMDREALNLFIRLTDQQLTKMMNELEKLYIYKSSDKVITYQDVEDLVPRSLDQNIFTLNDYILNGQVKEALELFQDLLLQKEDPIKLIALMLSQFRILLQVKTLGAKGYQQGEIASILKAHPYRIKLAMQEERKFSYQTLSLAHRQLIKADYAIKSGQMEPELQFELFVLQFSEAV